MWPGGRSLCICTHRKCVGAVATPKKSVTPRTPPSKKTLAALNLALITHRILVNEIDRNHEARTPAALARNCALIRELHANVTRVAALYANVSASFASEVAAAPAGRLAAAAAAAAAGGGDGEAPSSVAPAAAADAAIEDGGGAGGGGARGGVLGGGACGADASAGGASGAGARAGSAGRGGMIDSD